MRTGSLIWFRSLLLLLTFAIFIAIPSIGISAEKLTIAIMKNPHMVLPLLVAEEKGSWKEKGIDVQWVTLAGGTPIIQAIAAGSAQIGFIGTTGLVTAVAGGVDIIMVADFVRQSEWFVWVPADSPIRKYQDLQGKTMGVIRLGGDGYAFARALVQALNLEAKVKIVATGGTTQGIASLKARAIDSFLTSREVMLPVGLKGEVRPVVVVNEYLPKWTGQWQIAALREYVKNNPELVKKVARALLQSRDFIRHNRSWSINRMESSFGYDREVSEAMYDYLLSLYRPTGKIDPEAARNVVNFMVQWGLVSKEKAPQPEKLYTNELTD